MKALKKCGVGTAFVLMMLIAVQMLMPVRASAATVKLNVKKGADITEELQRALDTNQYSSAQSLKVEIPAGTYTINDTIKVYSNTTLSMKGVTIKRGSKSNSSMLRFGRARECTDLGGYSGYSGFSKITFEGGTWDSNKKDGSGIMRFAHANNVNFKNVTFTNVKNNHHIEFAGCSNVTFSGCTFSNFSGNTTNSTNYDALQIDIMRSEHFSNYGKYDETISKNITITGCTFKNLKRGVGTHSAVAGSYFTNIKITNNTFSNITGYAVIGTNYKKATITGNTIKDCGSGIFFRSIDQAHKTFYTPLNGKVKITRNLESTIANNTIEVKYKGYKNVAFGVSLYGEVVKKKVKDVPKGDYTLEGVTVQNNKITLTCKGYGIWLQGCDKNKILKNSITMQIKNGKQGNGDSIRLQNSVSNKIENNTITNKTKSGAASALCGISIIEHSDKTSLKGNKVTGSSKDGISVKDSKSVTMQGNTVTDSGRDGISVKTSKSAVIKSNKVTGNKRYGLNMTDNSTVTMSGNTVKKNKQKDMICSRGAKVNGKTKIK